MEQQTRIGYPHQILGRDDHVSHPIIGTIDYGEGIGVHLQRWDENGQAFRYYDNDGPQPQDLVEVGAPDAVVDLYHGLEPVQA